MASLIHTTISLVLFLILSLHFSPFVECRLTKAFANFSNSTNVDEGTNWAVLVAGSNGYKNYRHQADICHAYQILKRGGLKDENIIVFMYDDIAYNEENPRSGIIINNPQGSDVYQGVPKDYKGDDLTSSNLKAAILGDKTSITGGSGKVVKSGPNDRIFIYYADHGSPGLLAMPNGDDIYADDFINILKLKYDSGTYKSMVIYVEACEAGSIFEGLLLEEWNIYVTTASNSSESSWATYCPQSDPTVPSEYNTCLGDLYSVSWMEDSDANNPESETLEQQYMVVKTRTAGGNEHGSHVMEYGNRDISNDLLSLYMGISSNNNNNNNNSNGESIPLSTVEQHDADLIYLKEKIRRAQEGSSKKLQAQKELDETLSDRKQVDSTIQAIEDALFSTSKSYEILKNIRSKGQPLVDDWNCFKTLASTYKSYCGPLSTYGKKHMRAFANMCNAGVQNHQMAKVASQICGPPN